MDEKKQIFRQSSIDRISSPEDLNEYVRVANPSVWMVMTAVIILLAGFFIWGWTGTLESTVSAVCVSESSSSVLYLSEEAADKVVPGMKISCDGEEFKVVSVDGEPVEAGAVLSEYAMHLGDFRTGEWICRIRTDGTLPEGVFPAEVTVGEVSPMSFVLN